ncbi:MAG: YqhA family protein [Caldilineaceae bacterium]
MSRLIQSFKYGAVIASLSLLIASGFALFWGIGKTVKVASTIVRSVGQDPVTILYLVELVDAFLVAVVLFVLAVSIYELFLGGLKLPEWMLAHNLHELKAKLSGMIVLVMIVRFLEELLKGKAAQDLFYTGVAVALVSAVLVAFSHFGGKD